MSENKQDRPRVRRHGGGPMGFAGRPVEKAKDFKGTLKKLLAFLRPKLPQIIFVFILAIGSTIFTIIGPKILAKATDKLVEGISGKITHLSNPAAPDVSIDFNYIGMILLILIGLYLISSLLNYFQQYIMTGVTQNLIYNLRKEVDAKLNRLPLKFFDSRPRGDILSRMTNDIDNISMTLQQSATQVITSITQIIGFLIMMLTISPLLTLVTVLVVPVALIIVSFTAKASQKYFTRQQNSLGDLNGHIEEMYTGHTIIKAFGREKISREKYYDISGELYKSAWKAQFFSGILMPIINFVGNLNYVAVCIIGGIKVATGSLTLGGIQALITYSKQFTMPIAQTSNIANIIQLTIASAERVFELLGEEEEVPAKAMVPDFVAKRLLPFNEIVNGEALEVVTDDTYKKYAEAMLKKGEVTVKERSALTDEDVLKVIDSTELKKQTCQLVDYDTYKKVVKNLTGEVKFEDVNFGYSKDNILIQDMQMDVKEGETIAIVGPTGAGKTTIVNLIMRFYDVNSGRITIDDVDIRDFKRGDLRRTFGMVLQDTWLFNDTIKENLRYGRLEATDDEIIMASKTAYADRFIRTLPEGYDTVLNEEASNISQGQKQLLTIARAILANPTILILDEATSSVDTRTEHLIQEAMVNLMKGRTSFVIAHRLSTIKNADSILVMNHGKIIEKGTHQELLDKGGFYADLYNSQFKNGGDIDDNLAM